MNNIIENLRNNLKNREEFSVLMKIVKKINEKGGKTFLVGGMVRDAVMNISSKDIDVEIHQITPSQLKEILSKFGTVDEIGSQFGILKIKGIDIDFAMPRVEEKNGEGHKGFSVEINPFISIEKACRRRDLTMGAIMVDLKDWTIIDPFGGINDINNKVIRHVDSKTFVEDPLRVFRVAQFAARFNFKVEESTLKLMEKTDISNISKERVFGEFEKAVKKGTVSIFFKVLKETNKMDFFKEMKFIDTRMDNTKDIEEVLSIIVDNMNIEDANKFLNRFVFSKKIIQNVVDIKKFIEMSTKESERVIAHVSKGDKTFIKVGRILNKIPTSFEEEFELAWEQVKSPIVSSKDLISIGIKPGPEMGRLLKDCMDIQIQRGDVTKEEILKEVIF